MTRKVLGGKDFDCFMGDSLVHVTEASVKVTDGRKVKTVRGVPMGWIDGPVEAEVILKLDHQNFLLLLAQAQQAGSWKGIEPFDVAFTASVAAGDLNVDAFGCMPQLEELLNIKAEGGEENLFAVKCLITSPDFVHINGVPYLASEEVRNL
ncbi:phage protein [Pseudoalteromonas luteoviolacea]|uniref:Tail protein n=1 Tax=Pseudoalteromonas luteoviolacea S4060-1 TaxID=1365257 RepID=A0A167JJG5_9GAMM|nr:phage protein [Pseudoalteromonas luteoviolacea]KZN61203.1 tail protein [Pseudoalteromonas luteoviolacea S4060-1]